VAFLVVVLGAFLPVAWRLVLGEEDRARVLALARTVRASRSEGR